MDSLQAWLPQSQMQIGLTAAGAAAAAFVLLRNLLKKQQNLVGKVVLITGASSGIGEALAHAFVKAGSKVILAARSIDKLKKLRQELLEIYRKEEHEVVTFFLDLEDFSSIPEASHSLIQLYGEINILINNAGVACHDRVINMDMETYRKVLEINFFGQVSLTKELLPQMIESGGGSIVAVSSLQGKFAIPGGSAYGASKHALQAFCDSLRAENVKRNIHVLVVSPSYVKTNIDTATMRGDGIKTGTKRKEIEKGMSVEECANAIIGSIKYKEDELLIGPFHHRLMVYIRVLSPRLYAYIMSRL